MKNLIYFWIDNYLNFINPDTQSTYSLLDDFGINLSSKYNVTHNKKNDGSLTLDIKETQISTFFSDASEASRFYPNTIQDLKVLVGKNGSGKTTILRILSYIASKYETEETLNSSLKFCLLWQDEDGSFKYETNENNPVQVSALVFESQPVAIPDKATYNEKVIFYSSVFNDESLYTYPEGKHPRLYDIRTEYLIVQDVEDYNNNPDMYGLRDRLNCHSIMESIRQVNFVSAFVQQQDFLSFIFALPNKVFFKFSEGALRNHIHSFLNQFEFNEEDVSKEETFSIINDTNKIINDLNEKEDLQNKKRKAIENKWISFFHRTTNLRLKIRFALTFAVMSKYLHPYLNNWQENIPTIEPNLDDETCQFLLSKIHVALNRDYPAHIENKLYYFLKNKNMGDYFAFDLPSEEVLELLETIKEMRLFTPFMEMRWNRSLSSGESCYLRLFARLYDIILDRNKFNPSNKLDALFVIDEVDLCLHPEWQRNWFSNFTKGIELIQQNTGINLNLHLIIATHSPFMLTDHFNESIVRLNRASNESTIIYQEPFSSNCVAGNIYTILNDGFIIGGSIGTFIEAKLRRLLKSIDTIDEWNELNTVEKYLMNNIGDTTLKALLIRRKEQKND